MSDTRFSSDAARVRAKLQLMTGIGRYQLSMPGVGTNPGFVPGPHVRLQGWAGTMASNACDVESHLRGMSRRPCRDNMNASRGADVRPESSRHVPTAHLVTEESRTTAPAWERPALTDQQTFCNPGAPVLTPDAAHAGLDPRSRRQC